MTEHRHADLAAAHPLLFRRSWPARGLADGIAAIDTDALCIEYESLRRHAPRRSRAGKRFFVGHDGVTSSSGRSNRGEEHCAVALFNLQRRWPRPDGGRLRLLDYQVPLKARRADTGIGKIDLLGISEVGRLVIIELKVIGGSGRRSDAPPAALMEGLRYAAIVEAEMEAIAGEAEQQFGTAVAKGPPIVQLLAPESWWQSWRALHAAGHWEPAFARLADALADRIGVAVECVAFDDVEVTYGLDGQPPTLNSAPNMQPVRLQRSASSRMAAPNGARHQHQCIRR